MHRVGVFDERGRKGEREGEREGRGQAGEQCLISLSPGQQDTKPELLLSHFVGDNELGSGHPSYFSVIKLALPRGSRNESPWANLLSIGPCLGSKL